jgi:menaquinone-9 beta-reductase
MITCDALIVGGGPAGSSCAWQLRQAGLDVIVADAATFPRDKVCAGWITPQVVTALRLDARAYARGRTFQPITGFRVGLIGGRDETRVAYDGPASFGIRRCEFDHYLLQRSGARLRLGAPISSIRMNLGQWIVNGAIQARMLVGAGGSGCPVMRALNGARSGGPLVLAREMEARLDTAEGESLAIEHEVPELFFCRDLQGYGWCVRKGEYLNLGLGRLDPRSLPAATDRFVAFLEARQRIPRRRSWPWRGHSYAVNAAPRRRIVDDGVLLAGDAAAVADAGSGEGIRQAVESGLLAARTIVEAHGDYSAKRLEPYAARIEARYAERRLSALARIVPEGVKAAVAARLLEVPTFVRRIVLDQWFLHRDQPALGAGSHQSGRDSGDRHDDFKWAGSEALDDGAGQRGRFLDARGLLLDAADADAQETIADEHVDGARDRRAHPVRLFAKSIDDTRLM